MSFISLDRRFIFIHSQRTGGTSVSLALRQASSFWIRLCPHPSAVNVRADWSRLWREFFTFGIVRNPWEVWVSWYYWNKEWNRRYPTFRTFMLDYKKWYEDANFGYTEPAGAICDARGCPIVSFVGRYENLQQDFDHICDTVGVARQLLPHAGKTHHRNYRDYYDDDTREIVSKMSQMTIRSFHYEF